MPSSSRGNQKPYYINKPTLQFFHYTPILFIFFKICFHKNFRSEKTTMRSSLEASSPSCRSKKPNLRSSKKRLSSDTVSLSSKTPEKPPELTRRTRNRGVALSVSDVRRVAKGLQDCSKNETTPFGGKTARRQIALPSPRKPPKTNSDEEAFKLPQKYILFFF